MQSLAASAVFAKVQAGRTGCQRSPVLAGFARTSLPQGLTARWPPATLETPAPAQLPLCMLPPTLAAPAGESPSISFSWPVRPEPDLLKQGAASRGGVAAAAFAPCGPVRPSSTVWVVPEESVRSMRTVPSGRLIRVILTSHDLTCLRNIRPFMSSRPRCTSCHWISTHAVPVLSNQMAVELSHQ